MHFVFRFLFFVFCFLFFVFCFLFFGCCACFLPVGTSQLKRPVWHMSLMNSFEMVYPYLDRNAPTLRYFEDDTHYERQHVQCKLYQPFDLRAFPFDSQILFFRFSLDVAKHYAAFSPDRVSVSFDPAFRSVLEHSEWEVGCNVDGKFVKNQIFVLIDHDTVTVNNEAGDEPEEQRVINYKNYSSLLVAVPIRRSSVRWSGDHLWLVVAALTPAHCPVLSYPVLSCHVAL
jgi:hypothetical protein